MARRRRKRMNFAVIGAGFIGRSHAEAYKSYKNAEVFAICDVDEERARALADEVEAKHVFTDYEKLLEAEEVDAVSVCLPNKLHAPASITALKAGKHVLCEKPMATNAEEAQAMVDAAEKAGKVLALSLNFRYMGPSRTLKKLVEKGVLGEVYYGKGAMLRKMSIPRGWFHVRKWSGGGPLLDLASHILDVTWWVMGCPKPKAAMGATFSKFGPKGEGMGTWGVGFSDAPVDVEDLAVGMIKFENGATLLVEVSWALHLDEGRNYSYVYGTEAGATLVPEFKLYRQDREIETPKPEPTISPVLAFAKHLCEGTELLSPGKDGVMVMKMLDAIYRSARTGRGATIVA